MSGAPEDIEIELTALADGTLPAERREPLLARIADSPELAAELERQRRAVAIVRALEHVEAPNLLRRSLETQSAGEVQTASEHRERRPARLRLQAGAALVLAAVAVAALIVALTTGGSSAPAGAPTVLQASRAALAPATQGAPAQSPRRHNLLAASAAGISFPYWGGELGWRASGARTDTVSGRTVATVFYSDRAARRIGYSIVSGAALPIPAGSAAIERNGVRFQIVRVADPAVISWREAGHTCILTARGVSPRALVRLAAWQRT
jgi:hypothetical protein